MSAAFNWMAGANYDPFSKESGMNAYNNYGGQQGYDEYVAGVDYAAPKSERPTGLAGATTGLDGYSAGQQSGSATGGAISGAAQGYATGGTWGAVIGGISGYYGGKESEKKNDPLKELKYKEEIRQKMRQEQADAINMYKPGMMAPNHSYTNNALSGGGTSGLFSVKAPTQPVVNPEQNSYGLLRG